MSANHIHIDAPQERMEQALNDLQASLASLDLSVSVQVTREDRVRGKIIEALSWLDVQAPGRARQALEEGLRL